MNFIKEENNKDKEAIKSLKKKIIKLKKQGVIITDDEGRILENKLIKYGTSITIELVLIFSYLYFFGIIYATDFILGALCYALPMFWLFYYDDNHFNIIDYYIDKKLKKEKNKEEIKNKKNGEK